VGRLGRCGWCGMGLGDGEPKMESMAGLA